MPGGRFYDDIGITLLRFCPEIESTISLSFVKTVALLVILSFFFTPFFSKTQNPLTVTLKLVFIVSTNKI